MLFCKVKEVISMQWLEKIYGINCIKTEDLVPLRYLDSRTKVHVNMHQREMLGNNPWMFDWYK